MKKKVAGRVWGQISLQDVTVILYVSSRRGHNENFSFSPKRDVDCYFSFFSTVLKETWTALILQH